MFFETILGSRGTCLRGCNAATQQGGHNGRSSSSSRRTRPIIAAPSMSETGTAPATVLIQGLTEDGRTFRPSDWAERLAGAMSCFRPGGSRGGIASFIGYSPYCEPRLVDGVKCVLVDEQLRALEPMAWDFVINFARDNHLKMTESVLHPDAPKPGVPVG
jgi:hypothetical protein